MPLLSDYKEFEGLHWETGSVRNYFAYRGIKAPHTSEPYTEALLMGVSGGVVMGYFSFAYEGYDPHVAILTRNTFDPLNTLLQRLGVPQDILQTSRPITGLNNLVDTLENGVPAIVWADAYSLPYNSIPFDDGMWAMFPILVYGYDDPPGIVHIADRARVPLTITTGELEVARSRIKKTKYRILTLDPPNPDKLKRAVLTGIRDCISLYTEKPPKGPATSFGFKAYDRWAELLVKPNARLSWARVFPPGREMAAGLISAFEGIAVFGKDGGAERDLYADFLDEASDILGKPAISEAAAQFRKSARAWDSLGEALLPDDVPPFKETRNLILEKHHQFLGQGNDALGEIGIINTRLKELKAQIASDFPLSQPEVTAFRDRLRSHILWIRDIERHAIASLRETLE
jgi:Butirosin biosynthesis protein H, N-terminal/Domain of unknown function (DUF4872)